MLGPRHRADDVGGYRPAIGGIPYQDGVCLCQSNESGFRCGTRRDDVLLVGCDDIAPITGTKRGSRLEENTGADALELTADQLARLDASPPPVGDRYG
jgi:hypothetical protein